MKAAIFKGAGQLLCVEELPDPTPGPGDLVIKVGRCGVCGSDLHMSAGQGFGYPPGTIMGHEYSGEVVAAGAGTDGFRLGDIVTAMPCTGCGHCASCVAGFPLMCAHMQGMLGGYGEFLRCKASSSIRLPSSLSLSDGALVEPLAVGLHGVTLAGMRPGARVLVLGAGAVGLATAFWARQLGAGRLVVASRAERHAAKTLAMGADAYVPTGEAEAERIGAALGGTPEVVFECVGAVGMMAQAVALVGPNGTVVSLGFCTAPDAFSPAAATMKQARILFSFGYTLAEFQHVANVLDAGRVEPRALVTQTVSLTELPAMFESLRGPHFQTKVQVHPGLRAGRV